MPFLKRNDLEFFFINVYHTERLVNSRPQTTLSDLASLFGFTDLVADDLVSLTPNMFLQEIK